MSGLRAHALGAGVAAMVMVLATAAVVWGQKYRALADQRAGAEQLAALGAELKGAIDDELARVEPEPGSGQVGVPQRYRWYAVGDGLRFRPPLDDAGVSAAVVQAAQTPGSVYGPVSTHDGIDVLILSRTPHAASSGAAVSGVVVPVIALMQAAGIVDFVKRGHTVRISWAEAPSAAVFRSHVRVLAEPVTARIPVMDRDWLLQSEPVAGWNPLDEVWPLALTGGLLAFAAGAMAFLLGGKPRELKIEIDGLRERLERTHEGLERSLKLKAGIERRLHAVASLNAESGLTNRIAFEQLIGDELKALRARVAGGLSVLVVRLTRLRQVAAVLGPRRFFARIAALLDEVGEAAHGRVLSARLSDLDLALGLPGQTDRTGLEELAGDLCHRFRSMEAGGESLDLDPAVGIVIAADGYQYADELIQGALLAADEAHGRGDRGWAVYEPSLRETRTSLLQLEAQIARAIDGGQFRLFCQPIVRTADGALAGFETLLRWQHPVEGLLAPNRFLSVAEGSRHMPKLSAWCACEAVRLASDWLNLRPEPFYLSVNLLASDLERPPFLEKLGAEITRQELPRGRLRVEVTEREIVKDLSATARATAELEERGIHVLLDDFGTGYSSLTHLRVFRFHTVKIDRSFIASMLDEPRDLALVKAIVELVHELGMECIAEGVESEAQLELLRQIGCDGCQGYLFAKPVAPAQVPELLARFPASKLAKRPAPAG